MMNEDIVRQLLEKIMEKITDDHPFWRCIQFLALFVGGAYTIKLTLTFTGQEQFLKDAVFCYELVLFWFVMCYWALPSIFEKINCRKFFWIGWIVIVMVALAINMYGMITGINEPFLK